MINAVFFDFDGTIADTREGIIRGAQAMQRKMGLPLTSPEMICSAIGLPLRESLIAGSGVPEERADEAVLVYRELYAREAFQLVRPFDGVASTLDNLASRGIVMAIATSRSPRSLGIMLDSMGFTGYFSEIVTAESGFTPKPAPDMVLHLLGSLGCKPEETLVIGDTIFDILMGSGAGCLTCGVTYGNHDRSKLETVSPTYVIDDMRELLKLTNIL